jgi:opacity protein-like surface antigen
MQSMRRWMPILLVSTSGVLLSQTQDNNRSFSKYEVFGGYAANKFFYADSGESISPPNAASLFDFGWDRHAGFEGSVIRNWNRYVGVKGDFSLYYSQTSGNTAQGLAIVVPERAAYLMAGPELKLRNRSRFTPFFHALVGGAHSWANLSLTALNSPGTTVNQSHSRTGFSMAYGGGLDFLVNRRISLRWITDYSATFLGNPDPEESGKQNNVRFALGVLFHFR